MKHRIRSTSILVGIVLLLTACASPAAPAVPATKETLTTTAAPAANEAPTITEAPAVTEKPQPEDHARACETFIGVDAANFEKDKDVYWTLSLNFKVFDPTDIRYTYACLRVFGKPSTTNNFKLLNTNPLGTPVRIFCDPIGVVKTGDIPPSGSSLEGVKASVTTIGKGGYLACDFSVKKLIEEAVTKNLVLTTTVAVVPLITYTYSNFAIGIAARITDTNLTPVEFARFTVEEDSNMLDECRAKAPSGASVDACQPVRVRTN